MRAADVFPLQFGIPSGTELLVQLLVDGLLAALFGAAAFAVAGRRDPGHRLAWTVGTAGAALLSWVGGLVVLLLLVVVTDRGQR